MINTVGITGLYDALTEAITTKLDTLYTADKIDAETYAKLLAQSFDEALKLSVSAIQQQEQLDKESLLKDAELIRIEAEVNNLAKQGLLVNAQIVKMEKDSLVTTEEVLIAKEKVLVAKEEVKLATAKLANLPKEGALLDAQVIKSVEDAALTVQQAKNLLSEASNIPKQGLILDAQKLQATQQLVNLTAEKQLVDAKVSNSYTEGTVLTATKCKLDAEFDLTNENRLKSAAETSLLTQKKLTETAQVSDAGVTAASVIGRQTALYAAQTEGYARDAEQKASKLLLDIWSVRKTIDETGTDATVVNKLDDVNLGKMMTKLLTNVGVTPV